MGAYSVIGLLIAALVIAAFAVSQIRFGGPLHDRNRELSAFNADINPPPIYLVEAFALANVMAIHPESYEINEIRLKTLEREMNAKVQLWAASDMPEALKAEVVAATRTDAREFWNVVNSKLKPAVQSGDEQRLDKALNHLLTSYRRHRSKIDSLVLATAAAQNDLEQESQGTVLWVSALLVGLALLLAGALVAATWLLSSRVLVPLTKTADTMQRMAAGDLKIGRRKSDRNDEIGTMFDAMQVFRQSLQADREREAKQLKVVETLSQALDKLAAGDLTSRITEHFDETNEKVRQAFNASIERLARLMTDVRTSAESVNSGSNEIRTASDDLAVRNTQQAASLEETAAAMSEVTQLVKRSADNARVAQTSIAETHQQATDGGEVVQRAVGAMASIEESSSQITQIIDVIDGIAFQTNLLALNAGVEAARAGDAGQGFAVVANEVRALAQRSADAARDIKELISTSTNQVNEGVNLVGETGKVLDAIVGQIGTVTAQVQEIAETAVTQATNLEQVNNSVGTMDNMTQQNAAMVEETTAASRSLSDEAEHLGQLVARFKVSQSDTQGADPLASAMPSAMSTALSPPPAPMPAPKPLPQPMAAPKPKAKDKPAPALEKAEKPEKPQKPDKSQKSEPAEAPAAPPKVAQSVGNLALKPKDESPDPVKLPNAEPPKPAPPKVAPPKPAPQKVAQNAPAFETSEVDDQDWSEF
ncbi:MAG: HAMP domain-containing methyl-accepting chemotaxis protein [Pseudomonadota bacterium]